MPRGGELFLMMHLLQKRAFFRQLLRVILVQNAVLELLSRHLRAAHATKSMLAIDYCMLLHYQLLCRFKIKCIFDDVIVRQLALSLTVTNGRFWSAAIN